MPSGGADLNRSEARKLGMTAFLDKPIVFEDVSRAIRDYCRAG